MTRGFRSCPLWRGVVSTIGYRSRVRDNQTRNWQYSKPLKKGYLKTSARPPKSPNG